MSLIPVLIKKNIVKKLEKDIVKQKTYFFMSNYREKVVSSTLCDVVTETLPQLLFEGAKPGEVVKPSLHRLSLRIKRSKDPLLL